MYEIPTHNSDFYKGIVDAVLMELCFQSMFDIFLSLVTVSKMGGPLYKLEKMGHQRL